MKSNSRRGGLADKAFLERTYLVDETTTCDGHTERDLEPEQEVLLRLLATVASRLANERKGGATARLVR